MVELAPLDTTEISRGLRTHVFGRQIYYYPSVGSTNDIARDRAESGEVEGTLVMADEQTAGRGRMGRSWVAPAKTSVLMSLILRPTIPASELGRLGAAISLGVCEAITIVTKQDLSLKWPNDVMLQGRKVAGILSEAEIVGDEVEFAIEGIGINVNFPAGAVTGIPQDATTIGDVLGKAVSREPLVQAVLERCEYWYSRLQAGQSPIGQWKKSCSTLGQHVRVIAPGGVEEGSADDIDENGALILRRGDGTFATLIAGEVTLAGSRG